MSNIFSAVMGKKGRSEGVSFREILDKIFQTSSQNMPRGNMAASPDAGPMQAPGGAGGPMRPRGGMMGISPFRINTRYTKGR
jgi:hypothetical protein